MTHNNPSAPWMLPGLLAGFDFDPAQYTDVEVHPVREEAGGCERVERDADGISYWSVYLRTVPGADGFAPLDCVADLSNECAALCIAAALCAQYGYDFYPLDDSPVEAILIASRAPRYVIEPQRDQLALVVRNEASGSDTQFEACPEAEAETFALLYYAPGASRGDAELVTDRPTRADAVAFINGQRIGGEA